MAFITFGNRAQDEHPWVPEEPAHADMGGVVDVGGTDSPGFFSSFGSGLGKGMGVALGFGTAIWLMTKK